jgi:hypothetical protein
MESQQRDTSHQALALSALDERTRQMHAAYATGLTLEQVGKLFDLTRERVRQIFREAGLSIRSTSETRALRSKHLIEGCGEEIKAAFLVSHNVEQVAHRFGLPIAVTKEFIKAQFPHTWERRPPKPSEPKYPSEEILELLREAAAAVGGDLREPSYRRYAEGRSIADGRTWPSNATVTARFGSWSRALIAAGLKPLGPLSSQSRRKFSDEDCVAALRAATEKLGALPTVEAYREFARESDGAYPSDATLRMRFGNWYEVLGRAGLHNDPLALAPQTQRGAGEKTGAIPERQALLAEQVEELDVVPMSLPQ